MKKLLSVIVPLLVFASAAFIYLAMFAQHLFYVVQMNDLFLFDADFLMKTAQQPGFLLPYLGSFLTQFAFYPLVGIGLFVLLLTLQGWLAKWAFQLPENIMSLALIPSLLLVMYVMGWDYGLFGMRHYGNLFSPIVGCTLAFLFVGCYNRLSKSWTKYLWIAITLIAGYALIGAYAIMALVELLICDFFVKRDRNWIALIIGLVLAIAVPFIYARLIFIRFNPEYLYMAGLPYFDFQVEPKVLYPLYASLILCLLMPFFALLLSEKRWRQGIYISVLAALAVIAFIPQKSYNDSNFRTLLEIEHAYETGHDDEVLDLCARETCPIRTIIMYRNIELFRRGQLLDRMFCYSWASDTIASNNFKNNTFLSASRVFMNYTFFNFSYRWSMERTVKYKPSFYDTKMLAMASVYNREIPLSEKYLSRLDKTLFYKDWASEERKLYDENAIKEDSLYKHHPQLMMAPHGALDNTEVCEYMLMKHYLNLEVNSPLRHQLSLASAMVLADQDAFWKLTLSLYMKDQTKPLPKHVQEAAMLFAYMKQNKELMKQIEIMVGREGSVAQQWQRNADLITRILIQPTDADIKTLGSLCPGTYWYYYFNDARKSVMYD